MNWDPFVKGMKPVPSNYNKQTISTVSQKIKFVRTKSTVTNKQIFEGTDMSIVAMLLRKIVVRNLKQLFSEFKEKVNCRESIKKRMFSLINSNLHACKILSWQKLRKNAQAKRKSEHYLKNILNLLYRFHQENLGCSFHKIYYYSEKRRQKQIQILQNSKGVLLCSILKRIQLKRKQQSFKQMIRYKRTMKKLNKKFNFICLVRAKLQKQAYHRSFNKIRRFAYSQQLTSIHSPRQIQKRRKFQIEDMVVQIENKNQSIGRLTNQLNTMRKMMNESQSRQNVSMNLNRSFDRLSFKSSRSKDSKQSKGSNDSRHRDFSRKSSMQRSEKQFSVTSQDYNLGSILDSSFVSLGSNRSKSIFDRPDGDCNCQYRYKYFEYKSLHETHKNQLEILRKELQVAKDLNEHFQNQLKFYSQNQDHQEIQNLKTLAKEAQKQRENLRQKVYKYQKYIASLKMELRQKMQDLYRKVKKQQ